MDQIQQREVESLRPHPEAARVPRMAAEAFAAFKTDIAERGIQVPLEITNGGVVVDGHERLRAARELGLSTAPVRVIAPPDEVEYLLLAALQRRQLSASQRAALVLELEQYRQLQAEANTRRLANLKTNRSEVATSPPRGRTRELAARLAGVSPRTVQDAATVKAADPRLFEQVKQGALPADRAARQVRQRQRDEQLPASPPLPTGKFDLIYADPPWRLPGKPDSSRAVENHYPTMPLDEIKSLRVPAAENALLFLWGVNSMTPEALEVIAAWGFDYVTNFCWVKDKIGLGHYSRTKHELLHLGRRGSIKPPPTDTRPSSVIKAPRGSHSAKPQCVYELIETMYPNATKLELFARTSRPGWTAWGNQAAAGGPN